MAATIPDSVDTTGSMETAPEGLEASQDAVPVVQSNANSSDVQDPSNANSDVQASHMQVEQGQQVEQVAQVDQVDQVDPVDPVDPKPGRRRGHSKAQSEAVEPGAVRLVLILQTGFKSPIVLNHQFLAAHSLPAPPESITVADLKTCLMSMWNHEQWGNYPPSAAHIRLIYFGRLLEDSSALGDNGIVADKNYVMHLSVKPQSFELDAAPKTQKKGFRRGSRNPSVAGQPSSRSCCVIS